VDDIIVFRQLTRPEVTQIAELMIREAASRIAEQGISLEVSDRVQERVVAEGYTPSYGARPLRRAIARLLEDSLAEAMLSGQIQTGDTAFVDLDEEGRVVVKPKQSELVVAA
jgi:ATP-dependent Clp protease ATP-binding subunit ClpC